MRSANWRSRYSLRSVCSANSSIAARFTCPRRSIFSVVSARRCSQAAHVRIRDQRRDDVLQLEPGLRELLEQGLAPHLAVPAPRTARSRARAGLVHGGSPPSCAARRTGAGSRRRPPLSCAPSPVRPRRRRGAAVLPSSTVFKLCLALLAPEASWLSRSARRVSSWPICASRRAMPASSDWWLVRRDSTRMAASRAVLRSVSARARACASWARNTSRSASSATRRSSSSAMALTASSSRPRVARLPALAISSALSTSDNSSASCCMRWLRCSARARRLSSCERRLMCAAAAARDLCLVLGDAVLEFTHAAAQRFEVGFGGAMPRLLRFQRRRARHAGALHVPARLRARPCRG